MYCKFCGKECKNNNSLRNHERLCKCNPNKQESYFAKYNLIKTKGENQYTKAKRLGLEKPVISDETKRRMSERMTGTKLSTEVKEKISKSMKIAHKEGRAHNIGECRHNNSPSYPEKWFMRVIENELSNKQYKREFSFHKYSLDFAWPELKICIEIDGDQHQRFEEYKQRDLEKDKLLKQEGWTELRIPWKECFKNPKYYIEKVKSLF